MTAPLAPQDTTIAIKGDRVSKPYIDITLNLMKTFGVEIENQKLPALCREGAAAVPVTGCIPVEGDASSASYFLAAG